MPGRTVADNKFGPSPWVVGTTLGDGVNYSVIQDAINDAFAAGGGPVLIRRGTYNENLTIQPNVELIGVDASGNDETLVQIIGDHTIVQGGRVGFSNLRMDAVNNLFTLAQTAAVLFVTAFNHCSLISANNTFDITTFAGGIVRINFDSTNVESGVTMFNQAGPGSFECFPTNSFFNAASGDVFANTAGLFVLRAESTFVQADNTFITLAGDPSMVTVQNCQVRAVAGYFIDAQSVGHTAEVEHVTIDCGHASGFFINSIVGGLSLRYADIVNIGSAINIDADVTEVKRDWKPYAIEAPSPGTGQPRGTAVFNEDHFDVVDGFVSAASTIPYYSLTPYIVGPDVHSEFSTIGAAITQAVADGASGINQKIIHVKPTPLSYVENLTIPDGINVLAIQPTSTSIGVASLEPMPVRLQGNVTFSSGLGRITGFAIDPGTSNTFIVGDAVAAVINNCTIDYSAATYLLELTGTTGDVLFEGTSADGNAVFVTNQAGFFTIYVEDSTISGFGATSQLADNSQVIVRAEYSHWFGGIAGGVGTLGAFVANYSQISGAGLGTALISTESASLGGFHSLFEGGPTYLLDSTNIGNIELRSCSIYPYSFSASPANISQITLDQCTVLQVPSVGSSEIFKPTPGAVFRGTYSERFIVNIQTVDATPTAILTVPLLDPETIAVFGEVIGFDAAFTGGLSGPVNGSARRNGGAAILVTDQSSPAADGTLVGATFAANVSGNDLIVEVTGLLGVTINWSADIKVLHLQTDT